MEAGSIEKLSGNSVANVTISYCRTKACFRTGDLDPAGADVLNALNLGGDNIALLRSRRAFDMRKSPPRPHRDLFTRLGRPGTARDNDE